VKTFGEHTAGAVDYLDYYPVALPSGKYLLYIPATRRVIPKGEQAIDGKGIRPDVPIGDNTSDWVEFTKNYNEKN
jgi:C-terminal processing protease CtpA/Prc